MLRNKGPDMDWTCGFNKREVVENFTFLLPCIVLVFFLNNQPHTLLSKFILL